jgi:outer membrane immunogenic protein
MRNASVLRIAGAAGALFGLVSPLSQALAADVIRVVPPPAVVAPVFTWTGCHIGIHGGWGWGDKEFSTPLAALGDETIGVDVDDGLIGGQVGCDKQLHNGWVFGVEGAGAWTDIEGSRDIEVNNQFGEITGVLSARVQWLASITARIGRASGRHLWYVKGGAAFAGDEYRYTGDTTCVSRCIGDGPFDLNGEDVRVGWTIGAGAEWAMHSSWSLRVEYNYFDLGTQRVAFYGGTGLLTNLGAPFDISQRLHTSHSA